MTDNCNRGNDSMKIVVGADHAGFELKERIKARLVAHKYQVLDVGTWNTEMTDYPVFAEALGLALHDRLADRGILICGSGVGASIAANKIPGVRAGLCHDHYSAHQGVENDDMNVLVLGGRVIGEAVAHELVAAFLSANYASEENHERRLGQVNDLELNFLVPRQNYELDSSD